MSQEFYGTSKNRFEPVTLKKWFSFCKVSATELFCTVVYEVFRESILKCENQTVSNTTGSFKHFLPILLSVSDLILKVAKRLDCLTPSVDKFNNFRNSKRSE